LPHRYGNSHAAWDHTVLPATRQRRHSRPYPSRSWYSIKRPRRDARLSCDVCLQVHRRTHTREQPYQCAVCQRQFIQSGNLKLHMRVHTKERPYHCPTCSRTCVSSADLKIHARSHSGDKPFTCYVCQRRFVQLGGLKRHMASSRRCGHDLQQQQ